VADYETYIRDVIDKAPPPTSQEISRLKPLFASPSGLDRRQWVAHALRYGLGPAE
jgi:hypothetical protein